tara:strand:+ start:332 stop:484 length:153 start_codon:yes stop_codon:yes gene_type:complete
MNKITVFILNGEDGMETQGYKYFAMFNDKGGIYLKDLKDLDNQQEYIFNK